MKKNIVVLLILVLSLSFLNAQTPALRTSLSSLDSYYVDLLKTGTTLNGSTLDNGILHLIPNNSLIHAQALKSSNSSNSFAVSITSFKEFDEKWSVLSAEEQMLKIFNIVTSISSQKGIKYISKTSGNKEKVLIEDSYCISDLDKKNSKIADPTFKTVPEKYTLYTYQKDNRFSGNTYTVSYTTSENEIFMEIKNHTDLKFMGVNCVPKEQLSMFIDIYRTEEGLLISCIAEIVDKKPKISLLFYTVDLEDSFTRRIIGFKDWFIKCSEM